MEVDEEAWLNDIWTWYFHDPDEASWTLTSYHRLCDVSTIEELWKMHAACAPLVQLGMFFVMRENSFPCWDDKTNIAGGCASLKISHADVPRCWETILKRMLGETLVRASADPDADEVSGGTINCVSVSPKRGFCIVKLWFSDNRKRRNRRRRPQCPRTR